MNGAELVVDASLALKWVVEEPYSAEAKALLEHWRSHRKRLIAPALFLYEVTNVIAKRIQRGQLTLEQGRERLQFFLEAGPTLRQLGNLHLRALALMKQFRMTAAYDPTTLLSPNGGAASAGLPTSAYGTRSSLNWLGCDGSARIRETKWDGPVMESWLFKLAGPRASLTFQT